MSNLRFRVESFAPFDLQGAEAHLSAMAAKGWRLEKIGSFFWKYRRAEPTRLHYAVTCPPAAGEYGETADRQFFEDLCAAAGWEKVTDWAEMQVYVNPAEAPTPLETDSSILLDRVHRSMKGGYLKYHWGRVASAALLLLTHLSELWLLPRSFFLSNLSLGLTLTCLLLLLLHAASAAEYKLWRRRSLRSVEEGGDLVPVPGYCRVLDRLSNLWLFPFLLLPVLLELLFGNPLTALKMALTFLLLLLGIGFVLFLSWYLKRRKIGQDTCTAVLLLCVAALLLIFGRRTVNPADLFGTPDPEEGTYLWQGQIWDEEPQPLPLTLEDLTGAPYDHLRRWTHEEGSSPFASQTYYSETARREAGEEQFLSYEVLDVSNTHIYDILLKNLLDIGDNRPYQAEDPLPWRADTAYRRDTVTDPGSSWLICWPSRIVTLRTEGLVLTDGQMAEAARRLAPKEAQS